MRFCRGKTSTSIDNFQGPKPLELMERHQRYTGTTYACSENGWMLTRIFNEWFEIFCKTVTERPLLVIFDGHVTHLDPATIELAVRENVALLKLPPHTTDLLQPMDRSLFGPIKYKWNERLIEWQRLNQRSLTKSEFADLLCEVWRDGLSQEVIKNSFKVTGLYPVNKDVYPKDRLDPVKLDRFNKIQSSHGSVLNPLNVFEESPDDNVECVSPSLLEPGTSHDVDLIETYQNVQPGMPTTTTGPSSSRSSSDPYCSSFESLLLNKIKYTKPATGKRRKIDGKGKLLTSEEYLKSIENLETKKKKTTGPKKKKQDTTKNTSDSDTDIGDEEIPYADESDVENISLSALLEEEQKELVNESHKDPIDRCERESQQAENVPVETEGIDENYIKLQSETQVQLEYGVGDFILVVHTTKTKQNYYIARIEGSDDEENLSVIYLKRTKKIFFTYPDTHIVYSINKDEIVKKLPSPTQKIKRGALMFDVDLEKYNIK